MNRTLLFLVLLSASISAGQGGTQRPCIADAYTGGLWHLDETTPGNINDASWNGCNGTESGTSIVEGRFGSARHFSGQSCAITIPDPLYGSLDFSATQSFTVEAWFRTTSSATQTIVRKGLAPVPGYLLQMIGGKVVGNVGSYNENIYVFQSINRYDDGDWHHAALVVDRTLKTISLYVDGEPAATPVEDSSPFSVANDRPLTVGRWENSSWPYYFTGDIDEIRISPIARYAATDTVACWRMDEASGSSVADASPWHNDGTATGTAIVSGVEGNAREFDGASSVYIPNPQNGILGFSATESFTVEVSFKTTYASTQSMIRRGLAPTPGYLIQMIDGKVVGNVGSYDTKIHVFQSTNSYNDGQWHRAVLVADRDQQQIVLYVDGVLATTPVDDTDPFAVHNDRPFTFGRWENYDWPYFFHGSLDNVIVLRGAHHPAASTDPQMDVSPDSLGFGMVGVGNAASLLLTIHNSSSQQQLNVEMQTTDSHFSISKSYLEIAPGESEVISVGYCPTAAQSDTGSLILASNDPNQNVVMVPLTGCGTVSPLWTYVNTGTTHSVIIPTSANTGVNGEPLVPDDYVGAFYDSLGTPKCAGFERWTGTGNIAIAVFGDDPTTTGKDGFATGEVFQWKIFRATTGEVINVEASYSSPSGIVTHINTYAANGISRLESFAEGNVSHCLNLRAGWSLISSTVAPYVTALDTIFKPVLESLVILKNGNQKSYIPSVPVNTIGFWNSTEGYQVKMSAEVTLCFRGRKVTTNTESLIIPRGWSILPYLRDSAMSITTLLGSVSPYVVIVKDQDGKTFIPSAGINAIGTVVSGQAYQIKMTDSCTLEYPEMPAQAKPAGAGGNHLSACSKGNTADAPPWRFTNTGESHTVIVPVNTNPSINGSSLAAGDFIGVFYDSSGTLACAGYEMWTGNTNVAVAAFGDDATTLTKDGLVAGESLRWGIWRHSDGMAYEGRVSYQIPGSLGGIVTDTNTYRTNGISAVASLTGNLTDVTENGKASTFSLGQNYPNPFNPTTSIKYTVGVVSSQSPVASSTRLVVYDLLGREVAVLVDERKEPGYYTVQFNAANLASGIYLYRLTAGGFVETKRLTLLR